MRKTNRTPSQQNLSDSRKPIDHHRYSPQQNAAHPSMPRCLGPLVPAVYEKQTQSTPFYMDSGVVPSEWSEPRELPSNGQT